MTRIAVFTDTDLSLNTEVAAAFRAVLRHSPSNLHPRIFTAADFPEVAWPRVGRYARQLRDGGEHVVHIATTGPVGLAGSWLARRAGVPVVASVHEPLASPAASGLPSRVAGIADRLAHWALDGCQAVLVPSRAAADSLARRGFTRLRTWPRGVDTNRFAPHRASSALREIWHVDHRRPAILVPLAPLTPSDLAMIEPIRRSLHRHAIAHQFVFVGRHQIGVDLREVSPDGVFIESCSDDDLAVIMASANLCLFPGGGDMAGGMVLEAQASGLPAIVPDAGGAMEQVVAGRTAFLSRAGDVAHVVSCLTMLLRNVRQRTEMGRAARTHALDHGWPALLKPLYAAWQTASSTRRQPGRECGQHEEESNPGVNPILKTPEERHAASLSGRCVGTVAIL